MGAYSNTSIPCPVCGSRDNLELRFYDGRSGQLWCKTDDIYVREYNEKVKNELSGN